MWHIICGKLFLSKICPGEKKHVFHAEKTLIKRDLNAGKTRYKRAQV
jgi:hypothetical protein